MKRLIISLLAILFVGGLGKVYAQPGCPGVTVPDTTVCGSGCLNITANPVSGNQTNTYVVQSIPYSPFPQTGGNQVLLNIDDWYTAAIPLPFTFCFFGNSYNQMVIGSNGLISFNMAYANGPGPWAIGNAIPSPNEPLNSIMGPYHDSDPSVSFPGLSLNWQVYGTAPCRVMVINWYNIPMFSCNNLINTQQIALYETTNIIEMYIQDKPLCSGWNGGAAIQGIQNATGTLAFVVPGRNYPTQWTATNDAWAFIPNGPSNFSVNWYQMGNPVPVASTATASLCPTPGQSTDFVCEVIYNNCGSGTVTVYDTTTITIQNSGFNVSATGTDVSCFGGNNGTASAIASNGISPYTYTWNTVPPQIGTTATNLGAGTYVVSVTDSAGCGAIDSVTIGEPTAVSTTVSSVNAPCFGQNGSISASPTGGVGSYSYAWNTTPVQTGSTASAPAGTWTVIVQDGNGCPDTASATITQPTLLTVSATATSVSCNGATDGTTNCNPAGGTPPYSFAWNPGGQTTQSATNLPAGNYTVTVTDDNGCTAIASALVNQPTPLTSTISAQPVSCFGGSNGSATVVPTGGTGPYSYAWSTIPAQSNATANNIPAGTYSCTITDANGCNITLSTTVIQPTQLNVQTFGQDVTCAGFTNGSAYAVSSGGTAPYSYLWSNGATTASLNGLSQGTYPVTVTDANGCTATASVTINAGPSPVANAGPDIAVCDGEGGDTLYGSASGGTPGYYFSWSCAAPICGLSNPFAQNPNANPTQTTTYYLQVTDTNGCPSNIDSMVVVVIPKPIVDAGPDLYICGQPSPGAQITASVSNSPGPFTYQWTPATGLNNPNIQSPYARPDTTTIYTLVVVDLTTGCSSALTTVDTLSSVTVHVAPTPIANAGPDRSICLDDSIMLQGFGFGAGPSYTFEWSPYAGLSNPSIPNPMASPVQTTEYILTVWSNGCPSYGDTLRLTVNTLPTVDAGPDRDRCWGDAAMLDGQAGGVPGGSSFQYYWSPGAYLSDSTAEDPIANPPVTTLYYLQVMSDSGCISPRDSVLFTVRPTPIAEAGPQVIFCPGSGGDINLAGSYSWENNMVPNDLSNVNVRWEPSAYVIGSNNQDSVQVDPPSTMYFYYTVTYDSCFHTDSVLVTLLPEIIASVEADTTIFCEGDSVQLHASGGLGGGTYQWIPAEGLSSASVADPMASPSQSTTYTVVLSEAGCSDSASIDLEVIPLPDMSYLSSITNGCAPFTVHFMENSANATFLAWYFGDGTPVNNQDNPIHTYQDPGSYTVTLVGYGEGGCHDEISDLVVNVVDFPEPEFTSTPNFPVQLHLPNTNVQFTNLTESDVVSWVWDFGNGNSSDLWDPNFIYQQPGEYYVTLTVTNEYGCEESVTHGPYIVVTPDLFIPNVFTPNADGINDRFLIQYTGDQPFTMQIIDRWGAVQYTSKNKVEGWDGMVKSKQAPEGVYYYVLRIGDKDYNGELTLLR